MTRGHFINHRLLCVCSSTEQDPEGDTETERDRKNPQWNSRPFRTPTSKGTETQQLLLVAHSVSIKCPHIVTVFLSFICKPVPMGVGLGRGSNDYYSERCRFTSRVPLVTVCPSINIGHLSVESKALPADEWNTNRNLMKSADWQSPIDKETDNLCLFFIYPPNRSNFPPPESFLLSPGPSANK